MSRFRLDELASGARRARLRPEAAAALAEALETASRGTRPAAPENALQDFLLPFAESGLDAAQMLRLLEKLPADWPLSHRDIYYDFRLSRWQKHVEPPTIAESLDEYLRHSPSREEGLAYLRKQWREFLERNGAA